MKNLFLAGFCFVKESPAEMLTDAENRSNRKLEGETECERESEGSLGQS